MAKKPTKYSIVIIILFLSTGLFGSYLYLHHLKSEWYETYGKNLGDNYTLLLRSTRTLYNDCNKYYIENTRNIYIAIFDAPGEVAARRNNIMNILKEEIKSEEDKETSRKVIAFLVRRYQNNFEACDMLIDLYSKENKIKTKDLLKSIINTIPIANSEYKKSYRIEEKHDNTEANTEKDISKMTEDELIEFLENEEKSHFGKKGKRIFDAILRLGDTKSEKAIPVLMEKWISFRYISPEQRKIKYVSDNPVPPKERMPAVFALRNIGLKVIPSVIEQLSHLDPEQNEQNADWSKVYALRKVLLGIEGLSREEAIELLKKEAEKRKDTVSKERLFKSATNLKTLPAEK